MNDMAVLRNEMGGVSDGERHFGAAYRMLRRALDLLDRGGADEHPLTMSVLNNLADVAENRGLAGKAEAYRRRAETIRFSLDFRNEKE
jgi:hypothetical protein